MGEFKELRNEWADNPASFDQMKEHAVELLRSTNGYILMAEKEDGLHVLSGIAPGINSAGFLMASVEGLELILERMTTMLDEIEEEDNGQEA
jgi:hypothetical protein